MSQAYGESNLPLMQAQQNVSLYSLQSNLLKVWTERKVDKYYQTTMLAYMDDLPEQEAKQQIMRELERMLQNKSQYNKIKEYINHREQVLDILDEMLEDEGQIDDACQSLDELRKINLKLCQCIFAMKESLESRGLNANAICQGYNQMFNNLGTDNQRIYKSYLKKYIAFGKGFDPFFLVPYERAQKVGLNQQTPKCVTKLFKMNISYVYRLIKAKNDILKCLSCSCLDEDQNLGKQPKQRLKLKKVKQPANAEEEQEPKAKAIKPIPSLRAHNKFQNEKEAVSEPELQQPPVITKARELEKAKSNSNKNLPIKLPKIEGSKSKDKEKPRINSSGSRMTIKKRNVFDDFNGIGPTKSPILNNNFKDDDEQENEIDAYRKKLIARRLKSKPKKSEAVDQKNDRPIKKLSKPDIMDKKKPTEKRNSLNSLNPNQNNSKLKGEKNVRNFRTKSHKKQEPIEINGSLMPHKIEKNKSNKGHSQPKNEISDQLSEQQKLQVSENEEDNENEEAMSQNQTSDDQIQREKVKFTGRIRKIDPLPRKRTKQEDQQMWRYEQNKSKIDKSQGHEYAKMGHIDPHHCQECRIESQNRMRMSSPYYQPHYSPQNIRSNDYGSPHRGYTHRNNNLRGQDDRYSNPRDSYYQGPHNKIYDPRYGQYDPHLRSQRTYDRPQNRNVGNYSNSPYDRPQYGGYQAAPLISTNPRQGPGNFQSYDDQRYPPNQGGNDRGHPDKRFTTIDNNTIDGEGRYSPERPLYNRAKPEQKYNKNHEPYNNYEPNGYHRQARNNNGGDYPYNSNYQQDGYRNPSNQAVAEPYNQIGSKEQRNGYNQPQSIRNSQIPRQPISNNNSMYTQGQNKMQQPTQQQQQSQQRPEHQSQLLQQQPQQPIKQQQNFPSQNQRQQIQLQQQRSPQQQSQPQKSPPPQQQQRPEQQQQSSPQQQRQQQQQKPAQQQQLQQQKPVQQQQSSLQQQQQEPVQQQRPGQQQKVETKNSPEKSSGIQPIKPTNLQTSKNEGQESSQQSPSKREIQMKPGQITLPDLYKFIQDQKVNEQNRAQFEVGPWKQRIKQKHSYLTKFFLNSQLAAFGISTPRNDGDYQILYWGVTTTDLVTQFLFKKYVEYLEKFTSLQHIYIGSPAYQNVQFLKRDEIYVKKRSTVEKKQLSFVPFLSIQCSNLCFKQNTDMSHSTFFSEQIQNFNQQTAMTFPDIGLVNKKILDKLPLKSYVHQNVKNVVEVNKILQKYEADTYATSDQINTGVCKVLVMKDSLAIRRSEFYVRDGYFMTKGLKIHENGANRTIIYMLQMEKQGICLFFGKKFPNVQQFLKLCNFKAQGTQKYFAFKMFTKQLYGRMKNKQFATQGCYGNWDIDFVWQDQLKGVVTKEMPESNSMFGPENFNIAIFKSDILLYAFQINSNDFLF